MKLIDYLRETTDQMKNVFENSKLDSFVDIDIKNNSDLKHVSQTFIDGNSFNFNHNQSDTEKINQVLDSIKDNCFDTKSDNISTVNELLTISQKLGFQLIKASAIGKEMVGETVEELRKNIELDLRKKFKRNNLVDILNDDLSVDPDSMIVFNWNGIGSESSIRKVMESAEAFLELNGKPLSKIYFNIIVDRLRSFNFISTDFIDKSKDSKFVEEVIVQNITDSFDMNILYDVKRLYDYFKQVSRDLEDSKEIKNKIVSMCNSLTEIKKFLINIDSYKDNLEKDVFSVIKNNGNKILMLVNIALVGCLFYKENFFNDSILINRTTINGPIFNEEKKKGVTQELLAKYVVAYYPQEKTFPMYGIMRHEVNDSNIEEKLYERLSFLQTKRKTYLKSYLKTSFENVLSESFNDLFEKFNGVVNDLDYRQTEYKFHRHLNRASKRLFGSFGEAEKQLYYLIIETFMDNSLIESLYKTFNTNISKIFSTERLKDEDMSDEINDMRLEVYSDLIWDFLKNTIVS